MPGRRYPEARLVREFTNALGLTYREYADGRGNRTKVCLNPVIGRRKTPQQAAADARRTLRRMRCERGGRR